MIVVLSYLLTDPSNSALTNGLIMLGCLLLLIVLVVLICRFMLRSKKLWIHIACALILMDGLIQATAACTLLSFQERRVVPEALAIVSQTDELAPWFSNQWKAFTLTDTPPAGTCKSGNMTEEDYSELAGSLGIDLSSFDFDRYSYLFVLGRDDIALRYSQWDDGNCWYFGSKGCFQSFRVTSLEPAEPEDQSVYLFRFPKTYLAFFDIPAGEVNYFGLRIQW